MIKIENKSKLKEKYFNINIINFCYINCYIIVTLVIIIDFLNNICEMMLTYYIIFTYIYI